VCVAICNLSAEVRRHGVEHALPAMANAMLSEMASVEHNFSRSDNVKRNRTAQIVETQ
jgi:hypothetical protein